MDNKSESLTLEKLEIHKRLVEVEKNLAESKPIREQILDTLKKLDKSIEAINYKINGNGRPGIEERLRLIEITELSRQKAHDNIIKIGIGAITALSVTILSWIGKLIIAFIK